MNYMFNWFFFHNLTYLYLLNIVQEGTEREFSEEINVENDSIETDKDQRKEVNYQIVTKKS